MATKTTEKTVQQNVKTTIVSCDICGKTIAHDHWHYSGCNGTCMYCGCDMCRKCAVIEYADGSDYPSLSLCKLCDEISKSGRDKISKIYEKAEEESEDIRDEMIALCKKRREKNEMDKRST